VRRLLVALDGVEEPDGEDRATCSCAGAARARERTVIGTATLGDAELRLETNSVERADALRAQLEKACPGILGHQRRDQENPDGAEIGDAEIAEGAFG